MDRQEIEPNCQHTYSSIGQHARPGGLVGCCDKCGIVTAAWPGSDRYSILAREKRSIQTAAYKFAAEHAQRKLTYLRENPMAEDARNTLIDDEIRLISEHLAK